MGEGSDDDISGAPLTEAENKKLRRMIRDEERMIWLWATLRIWGGYAAAAIGTAYLIRDQLSAILKTLLAR